MQDDDAQASSTAPPSPTTPEPDMAASALDLRDHAAAASSRETAPHPAAHATPNVDETRAHPGRPPHHQ